MKQLALFLLSPEKQAIMEQRVRDRRAEDLLDFVGKIAHLAPPSLLDDLHALAEIRRHDDEDSLRIANAAIWPDFVAWLDDRIKALPDGNKKDGARAAWIKARRRAWFTFPEYWFAETIWRTE